MIIAEYRGETIFGVVIHTKQIIRREQHRIVFVYVSVPQIVSQAERSCRGSGKACAVQRVMSDHIVFEVKEGISIVAQDLVAGKQVRHRAVIW